MNFYYYSPRPVSFYFNNSDDFLWVIWSFNIFSVVLIACEYLSDTEQGCTSLPGVKKRWLFCDYKKKDPHPPHFPEKKKFNQPPLLMQPPFVCDDIRQEVKGRTTNRPWVFLDMTRVGKWRLGNHRVTVVVWEGHLLSCSLTSVPATPLKCMINGYKL